MTVENLSTSKIKIRSAYMGHLFRSFKYTEDNIYK